MPVERYTGNPQQFTKKKEAKKKERQQHDGFSW
jgi:hypothetical protein